MGPETGEQNYEKDYDDAFDEASGDPATEELDSGTDEASEPTAESTGAEGSGESTGDESAAADAGDDTDAGGEAGAQDPAAVTEHDDGGEVGAEGDGGKPAAAEGEKPTVYDEETVRRAADLIRQQTQQQTQQQPEPAADDAEGGEDPNAPIDYSKVSWEDYIPEDKKAVVQKYREEWSEVQEAEEVIRSAQLQLVQDRLYSDLRSALAPVFETTRELKVNAHLNSVREVHPDLDEVKDELKTWIDGQPEFVRGAYKEVAQKGSAAQVIELLTQFKQSTGKTSAVPEVPASSARTQQQRAPAKKQPPAAAKKALAAAPSPSTAEVPGSARSEDFDAAWEEAAGLG